MTDPDDRVRCTWANDDAQMCAYHDHEWGVPERDARALWEKLMLDGFQAGLSWRTVLHKRAAFRAAFEGFDPRRVARYGERDVERLLANPGIIRSRAKIQATIHGAKHLAQDSNARRALQRLLLAVHRRQGAARQGRALGRDDAAVRAHLRRDEAARLQVRRADDRLRVDAGRGHRQRPRRRLLPARRGVGVFDQRRLPRLALSVRLARARTPIEGGHPPRPASTANRCWALRRALSMR